MSLYLKRTYKISKTGYIFCLQWRRSCCITFNATSLCALSLSPSRQNWSCRNRNDSLMWYRKYPWIKRRLSVGWSMTSERWITQRTMCHHILHLILQALALIFLQICNPAPSDKIGFFDKVDFDFCGKYTNSAGCCLMEGFIQTFFPS